MRTRVTFEVSPGEWARFQLKGRGRARARTHRVIVVAAGVLAFVVVAGGSGGSRIGYAAAAIVGLLAAGAAHLAAEVLNRWQVRRSLAPLLERHGGLSVEVEIQDGGVLFRQLGLDILIHWSEIADARSGRDGVEIWSPERMIGLVRRRGFDSEVEMTAFMDEIRRRAAARGEPPDQRWVT